MATPLFWKSWDVSNKFYSQTLKYCFLVKMNTQKQCFEVEKRQLKLIPLYICYSFILLLFLSIIFVLFIGIFSHNILTEDSLTMLYIGGVAVVGLILTLALCILPIVEIITCQYYNRLMQFEMNLLKSKNLWNVSFKTLIIEGMSL